MPKNISKKNEEKLKLYLETKQKNDINIKPGTNKVGGAGAKS